MVCRQTVADSGPPLLEPLEPRLLLAADLYIDQVSFNGYTGVPGTSCSLQIDDIGNLGDTGVLNSQIDLTWYLSPDSDPAGTRYALWSGTLAYNLPAYSGGGTLTAQGVVPAAPTGDYYMFVYINYDHYPPEFQYGNNYRYTTQTLRVSNPADPGSTASDAAAGTVGTPAAASIEWPEDIDWYKVYLQADHSYNLETVPGTLTDPIMGLYDVDGSTLIVTDADGGAAGGAKLVVTPVNSGYYYVAVGPHVGGRDYDLTGTYTLQMTERPPAGPVEARGRAMYKTPDGSLRPLRYVEVQLFDAEAGPQPDNELLAITTTDGDGYFDISLDQLGHPIINIDYLPELGTRDLYVLILASTPSASISDDWQSAESGFVWAVPSPLKIDVQDGLTDFGNVVMQKEGGRNYGAVGLILDSIGYAQNWLFSRTGYLIDQMTVLWPYGKWPQHMSYDWQDGFSAHEIWLPGNLTTSKKIGDPVGAVVHEYGHAIQFHARGDNFPPDDFVASKHTIITQSSPVFAFAEGWAEFFESAVFDNPDYLRLETNSYWMGPDGLDGTNDDANTGEIVESAVASILWDIYDPANDDGIDSQFSKLWTVFLNDDPVCIWNHDGTGDFYHAWVNRYGPSDALDEIFRAHGIPVRDEWNAPDLSAAVGAGLLPHTIVPGDAGLLPVVLANSGLATATGNVTINLYASTDQTLDAADVLLKSQTVAANIVPGGTMVCNLALAFNETMPVGTRYFVAEIVPAAAVGELNSSNNVAAGAQPHELAWKFGTFDGRSKVLLSVHDAHGNLATFSVKGSGYGEIQGGSQMDRLTLYATNASSMVSIVAGKGAPGPTIGEVVVNGSLRSLSAPAASLQGNLTVTGRLGSLSLAQVSGDARIEVNTDGLAADPKLPLSLALGRVQDASIETNGLPISSLTAIEWLDTGGTIDLIRAPSLATLSITGRPANTKLGTTVIRGDFQADVLLTNGAAPQALGNMTVAGWLDKSQILSAGPIALISAGAMRDSSVLAGVGDGVQGLPDSADDFSSHTSIGSFSIMGILGETYAFLNSSVAAWTLGAITLRKVETANSGHPGTALGVAGHTLTTYTRDAVRQQSPPTPGIVQHIDDFIVRLV